MRVVVEKPARLAVNLLSGRAQSPEIRVALSVADLNAIADDPQLRKEVGKEVVCRALPLLYSVLSVAGALSVIAVKSDKPELRGLAESVLPHVVIYPVSPADFEAELNVAKRSGQRYEIDVVAETERLLRSRQIDEVPELKQRAEEQMSFYRHLLSLWKECGNPDTKAVLYVY